MNAADMARRGIKAGDLVRVESRRGAIHVIAEADEDLRSGQVYLPMHWGKRFLGGAQSDGTNTLTVAALDPVSRQPELKHAAVKVSVADYPWRLTAFAECEPDSIAQVFDGLQALQRDVAFASAVLIGRERPGVLLRAANEAAPPTSWLETLDRHFALDGEDILRYEDSRRGHSRRIRIAGDRLLAARLAGEPGAITSGEWLREWLIGGRSIAEIRSLLLSPATHAPSGFVLAGRVLCQCFNVSEQEILAALPELGGEARERLASLQSGLKCGTNCGSCVPELRALVEKVPAGSSRMVA